MDSSRTVSEANEPLAALADDGDAPDPPPAAELVAAASSGLDGMLAAAWSLPKKTTECSSSSPDGGPPPVSNGVMAALGDAADREMAGTTSDTRVSMPPPAAPQAALPAAPSPQEAPSPSQGDAANPIEIPDEPAVVPSAGDRANPIEIPDTSAGEETSPIEIFDASQALPIASRDRAPASKIEDGLVIFSDGSFLPAGSGGAGGAGVACNIDGKWCGRAVALGWTASSTQAEMHAVFEALKMASQLLRPEHRRLVVRTDCEASLAEIRLAQAGLRTRLSVTRDVLAEHDTLLERGVEVELHWVKGHNVSTGNHLADQLAGMGSQQSLHARPLNPSGQKLGILPLSEEYIRKLAQHAQDATLKKRRNVQKKATQSEQRRLRGRSNSRSKVQERRPRNVRIKRINASNADETVSGQLQLPNSRIEAVDASNPTETTSRQMQPPNTRIEGVNASNADGTAYGQIQLRNRLIVKGESYYSTNPQQLLHVRTEESRQLRLQTRRERRQKKREEQERLGITKPPKGKKHKRSMLFERFTALEGQEPTFFEPGNPEPQSREEDVLML